MIELYTDAGSMSLTKHGEQLCGDNIEFRLSDHVSICVLADGLGSGVKANILATLTSQILATMSEGGMSIEDCVDTIVRTLPKCSVRHVNYSTFTIVKIRDQKYVELTRFDNPHTVVLRNGKNYEFKYHSRMIEDKKIYFSDFEAEENDVVVVMSDGAIYAGLGGLYPFGWGRDKIIEYLEAHYHKDMTAKGIATLLARECNRLYEGKPGDDTSFAVMRLCPREHVNLMIGPPSAMNLDDAMVNKFFASEGMHIVCGGSTNRIAARYLGKEVYASLDYGESDLPPVYSLEGVDLATEGVVTISKVLEYAQEHLEGKQLNPAWKMIDDGASRIAHALFERATDVHFFVGCAINPAHQNPNLPIAFGAKFQLIDQLSKCLEKMGKKVSVRFY
ncbi:MAG: SpoIIE family protein phosphatase [Clostridia bacterium]|nr:SpoIIE family protein phosphatase [Clostridia bacterium]